MSRWPDLEALAYSWLSSELEPAEVATNVPSNVEELGGFVRVIRGPGRDDGVTDSPLLDVEVFHPDQGSAADLAEDARQAVHRLAGSVVDGALVDAVSTASGPVRVYYGPHVERYVASYRLHLRRIP